MNKQLSHLKRSLYPIPEDILSALENKGLLDKYYARPPYQRNDCMGWITRAKREETRENRIRQMIDELNQGATYIKMEYNPKRIKK